VEHVAHPVGGPFLLQFLQRDPPILLDGRYQPQTLSNSVTLVHVVFLSLCRYVVIPVSSRRRRVVIPVFRYSGIPLFRNSEKSRDAP
jgi:hypothetical protein